MLNQKLENFCKGSYIKDVCTKEGEASRTDADTGEGVRGNADVRKNEFMIYLH